MTTIGAMTTRAPEAMTGDERLQEVATILAAANSAEEKTSGAARLKVMPKSW